MFFEVNATDLAIVKKATVEVLDVPSVVAPIPSEDDLVSTSAEEVAIDFLLLLLLLSMVPLTMVTPTSEKEDSCCCEEEADMIGMEEVLLLC